METSAARLERYLDRSPPFDDILLTLFAHGVDSVGLPQIERWQALLRRARRQGALLGVNARTYPAHFSVFARYQAALKKWDDIPVPFDSLEPEEALGTLAEDPRVTLERLY